MTQRQLISSGSKWEPVLGYSRAVRVGKQVFVSGTTAPGPDAASQTTAILQTIEKALQEAGASLQHAVRGRIYTTCISEWESIGKAYGSVFKDIRPALAMVEVSKLIDPAMLVEIEVDAVID